MTRFAELASETTSKADIEEINATIAKAHLAYVTATTNAAESHAKERKEAEREKARQSARRRRDRQGNGEAPRPRKTANNNLSAEYIEASDAEEGAAEAANNLEDEVMADVNTEAKEPADNIEDEAMANVNSEAAPALAPVTPDRLDRDTDLDMDNGTADPGPIGDFAPERGLSVTPTPAGPVQHTSAMELDLASDQVSDYQSSMPGFSREHTWIAQTDTGANTADTTPQPAPSCMF